MTAVACSYQCGPLKEMRTMNKTKFELNSRSGYVLSAALALIALYVIAIRAIDTGSQWLYLFVLILIVFTINRLIKAIRGK